MAKVLITTIPFGEKNRLPLKLLENAGIECLINPFKKKITEDQLAEIITDFDAIIAGTEPITENVMERASNLKLISRVGIGLDSVDLLAAQKRGIKVSYTPDVPAYQRSQNSHLDLCLPCCVQYMSPIHKYTKETGIVFLVEDWRRTKLGSSGCDVLGQVY